MRRTVKACIGLGVLIGSVLTTVAWGAAVEADPNKTYWLSPQDGPWLICAASFYGDDALEFARKFCLELRRDYKLNAFVYSISDRKRQENKQFLEELKQRGRKIRIPEEYAVMVGNYRDMYEARRALTQLKKMKPPQSVPLGKYFIFDAQHAKNSLKQKGQIEYQHADNNPFVTAFVCPNPLTKQGTAAPVRTAAADSDTDTHQLNQSELYSLLRCNKPWTLVVKVYPRTGMLGNEKPSVLAPEGLFRSAFGPKPGVKEKDATELARQLATALRRPDKGLDAYVYHTRNSSMVTVGGFNSPSDPELMKYQRLLSGMKLLVQGETIELMAQPTPMPVPRTR